MRTLKVRLYPNKEQERQLNEWGAGTEWAYMKCPELSPSEVKGDCLSNIIEPMLCNVATGFKALA